MARPPRLHPSSALFESVVKNALDFLNRSVSDLPKRPKYSVINFCSPLELFLKARLMLEHWSLIVAKPETASLSNFQRGAFRSVSMQEAMDRLRNVSNEPISREEEACFALVREHRNKLVHFFHEQYAETPDEAPIEDVVAEQCKAWFYLHQLLTGRWSDYFRSHAVRITRLNTKMHANRIFLKAKYTAITPKIAAEVAGGAEYALCFSCGVMSLRIVGMPSPLYQATCQVCGVQRSVLRVACPECGEQIEIRDLTTAECPNEDFTPTLEWLIEKYGPFADPSEESELAYCSYCGIGHSATVVPFGNSEYLCLTCLQRHDSVRQGDWCGELNAGRRELSYLGGCVVCDGKFGSHSFIRE